MHLLHKCICICALPWLPLTFLSGEVYRWRPDEEGGWETCQGADCPANALVAANLKKRASFRHIEQE